jgi:hypothetical protein
MAKRRTSGIQRRSRATDAAMTRRIGSRGAATALDPRILIVGGVLVVGAIVLVVVVLFAGSAAGPVGQLQVDDGGGHVGDCQPGGPFSSVPATSGSHWTDPAQWGVYAPATPAYEAQVVHNLEHGGIVVWYQPALLNPEGIQALTDYVHQQVRGAKFKMILSPWTGQDFGHPIAVTAWNWLLYLDSADIGQVRAFVDAHYGKAPEPNGGPGQSVEDPVRSSEFACP